MFFKDAYCCSYTDIDITSIIKSWLEENFDECPILSSAPATITVKQLISIDSF